MLLLGTALAPTAQGATFTVTTTADAGAGSLRQAILDANASPDASDTILFTLPAGSTITLASDLDDLANDVVIDATGAPGLVVDGGAFQILGTAGSDVEAVDLGTDMGDVMLGPDDTLTLTANNDFEVSSDIGESGAATGDSLVKQGIAVLTLSGTNTFTGSVQVDAGTLVGDTDSLPDVDVDVASGASLVFDQAADDTFTGAITGAGSFTKDGAGDLTLTGANTYTGGTTVAAGTLTGDTTSLQGGIVNDAAVVFDQPGPGTFAGAISGTGSVTKDGAGNLTLTGTHSYTGGTTVAAGTLTGDTTSLQGDIVNDAAVVFAQAATGTFAGAISGTGSVTKDGAGSLTLSGTNSYTGGTTLAAGTLVVDTDSLPDTGGTSVGGAATLVFDQSANGTFADVVSGGGEVVKQGSGNLTLSAAHLYTGDTTVDAGTLTLDGSLVSATTVESSATLAGTGSISAPVTLRGVLSLAGGALNDAFTVNDTVSFDAGSRFVVDVAPGDVGDTLMATGAVSVDPTATLEVRPAPGDYTLGTTVTVLDGASVAGTFLEGDPFAFLDRTVTYPGGGVVNVTLVANGANLATVGNTPNQRAVGTALATLVGSPDPDLTELFDNLNTLTAPQAAPAFDALSGESLSALTSAREALGERTQRAIGRRARLLLFAPDAAWPAHLGTRDPRPRPTRRPSGATDVAAPPRLGERGLGVWLEPFGVLGALDGDGNSADVDYGLFGANLGVDLRVGDHGLVGVAAGYARTEVDVDDRNAEGDADTVQGAAYAAFATGLIHAGLSGRYAFSQADHRRDLVIGTLRRTARADFDSHDVGVRGELALRAFDAGPVAFEPLAAFGWSRLDREGFDERGAGSLGLSVGDETLDSALLQVGARLHALFDTGDDAVLTPELRGYWLHEFGDDERRVEASLSGAPFTVTGAEAPRDSAVVGAGWAVALGRNVRATAEYDVRIDADRLEHQAGITVRVRF